MKKKFHYLYCIENTINGKVYVGKHSTDNLDDGYMGSGVAVLRAIKKNGIENFRKHILQMCESLEEILEFERQIVDEEFIKDENTYNLAVGGKGGFQTILWETDIIWQAHYRLEMQKRNQRLHAEGRLKIPSFAGFQHNENTKRLISLATRKLTDEQVTKIRENRKQKITLKQLSIDFDVSISQIKNIIYNKQRK